MERFEVPHLLPWRAVAMEYPCEQCGAGPGEPCLTMSGKIKYEVHAWRSDLASVNGWKLPESGSE